MIRSNQTSIDALGASNSRPTETGGGHKAERKAGHKRKAESEKFYEAFTQSVRRVSHATIGIELASLKPMKLAHILQFLGSVLVRESDEGAEEAGRLILRAAASIEAPRFGKLIVARRLRATRE